jgi:hypothetical protein
MYINVYLLVFLMKIILVFGELSLVKTPIYYNFNNSFCNLVSSLSILDNNHRNCDALKTRMKDAMNVWENYIPYTFEYSNNTHQLIISSKYNDATSLAVTEDNILTRKSVNVIFNLKYNFHLNNEYMYQFYNYFFWIIFFGTCFVLDIFLVTLFICKISNMKYIKKQTNTFRSRGKFILYFLHTCCAVYILVFAFFMGFINDKYEPIDNVMLHELGHVIGLPHNLNSSIMVPEINKKLVKVCVNYADLEALSKIYNINYNSSDYLCLEYNYLSSGSLIVPVILLSIIPTVLLIMMICILIERHCRKNHVEDPLRENIIQTIEVHPKKQLDNKKESENMKFDKKFNDFEEYSQKLPSYSFSENTSILLESDNV